MEALGNGIVVVCGIFEPGAVVELIRVSGGNILRAEGGETMGRRTVDGEGRVGFSEGLTPGDQCFVCGYVNGRYEQVRVKAQDPSLGITLFQPPAKPIPTTVGTDEVPTYDPLPAPVEASEGTGLPTGVESPVLEPEAPSSSTSTIPVEVTTRTTASPKAEERELTSSEATTPEAAPAPEPSPPAEQPTEEIPASELPDAPPEQTIPVEPGSPHDLLFKQAQSLLVANAASMSDGELRQAITEKNVTPVV